MIGLRWRRAGFGGGENGFGIRVAERGARARECGPGGEGFEAASAAAVTLRPGRVDDHMADLGMLARGAPEDRAIDQYRAAEAGADGQHQRNAGAAGRASQRLAQQCSIRVVDEPHRCAEAGDERAHDVVSLPSGEGVEILDPPARFVEGAGATEANTRKRGCIDVRLGQGLVDGPGEPLKPCLEACLGVGRNGPPRMHRTGRIDRADRDLGSADIDAHGAGTHGSGVV